MQSRAEAKNSSHPNQEDQEGALVAAVASRFAVSLAFVEARSGVVFGRESEAFTLTKLGYCLAYHS